ncbi:MAG: hypothetical protein SOZ80_06420 [Prevotella sp.]|uniref:hypothetical protein n=1 Tax=Prevotella sp. TaxID=59823 RepID=UPI002A32B8C5|nr:hypothetical protein [Prevotella sp.]MDD7318588.1 hypothetical protein [Prevotellaceae bacterium]MDY4020389.1 hypothetical protein [Prevotella sp.]
MKKSILVIILCAIGVLSANSQETAGQQKKKKEKKIWLCGGAFDSFTKAKLAAKITLMKADSTVVDTITCQIFNTSSFAIEAPARREKYIFKATLDGYEDTFMDYDMPPLARNTYFEVPKILMKRSGDDAVGAAELDGVTVTGTRVKIAYRGDTIVYNASAFKLPEGSMLDALVKQLPGAELKDNGDIYVNGTKVDYLTLNGKDFFKGKNRVMLDNLPYYTVKDLKVYHKSTEMSQKLGREVERKDYVMDVSLKREYNRGLIANAEAGGGTRERYMSRMFALYFGDHNKLSLYGNANNVNESRKPGEKGEWSPSDMPQGTQNTKQVGLLLHTEDPDEKFKEKLEGQLEWSDGKDITRSSKEVFAAEGNILGGSQSDKRQKNFKLNAKNELELDTKLADISLTLGVDYTNGNFTSYSKDSTYRQYLINQSVQEGRQKYNQLNTSANLFAFKKLPWGDHVKFTAELGYERMKPYESFANSNIRYAASADERRELYGDFRTSGYNYDLSFSYGYNLTSKIILMATVGYLQEWSDKRQSNYRLDWLDDTTPHEIGWLPSTNEALNSVLDRENSNNHRTLKKGVKAELMYQWNLGGGYLQVALPLTFNRERMSYNSAATDTLARRCYTDFNPAVLWLKWGKSHQYFFFDVNTTHPQFASLMPNTNTTNPLRKRLNNPALKPTDTYRLVMTQSYACDSIDLQWRVAGHFNLTRNAWGTRTIYDTATGAYTYIDDNVNGNFTGNLSVGVDGTFDKQKRLRYSFESIAQLNRSVDFGISYDSDNTALSRVNSLLFTEKAELSYSFGDLNMSILGQVGWRRSKGREATFRTLNTTDFSYGATLQYRVPLINMSIGTDIKMFSRRGYFTPEMNTNDLVWNMLLSRSFMTDRLTLKFQAFDILRRLSNKQYVVNAQGRTESWTNCIPRYFMLTAAYKINIMPKGK